MRNLLITDNLLVDIDKITAITQEGSTIHIHLSGSQTVTCYHIDTNAADRFYESLKDRLTEPRHRNIPSCFR